ncbi:MAG TPA: type III pantothenate kinase [Aggregatilineales bacterium]|nr:type III pantothenate kinase [Aggregatilineales bacterium]
MLLAIDIGNTNIQFGLYPRGSSELCCSWRAQTVHQRMGDEYAVLLRNFFTEQDLSFADVSAVVLASVVPPLTPRFVEMSERYLGQTPLVVTPDVKSGVRVLLDNPDELGADRLVNAAAVKALYGTPAIVIDFGTATTFDVVNRDGDYVGGAITVGIGLAQEALVSHAARLVKVDIEPPPSAIGRSTVQAMQSGLFLGYTALIEGMVQRLAAELGEPNVHVIATGGRASHFAQHTPVIQATAPSLTLDGLRIIWEMNQPG